MRPDKAKVVDEVWDDARIDSFLNKGPMGQESEQFSLLLHAYRSMRADDFERFIVKYKAGGGNVHATDQQGRSLLELIAGHTKAQRFREILSAA